MRHRIILSALALLCATCATWRPTVRVLPEPKGACAWPRLPLTVAFEDDTRKVEQIYLRAMNDWSRALGTPAFIPWDGIGVPNVYVIQGAWRRDKYAETGRECTDGREHIDQVITIFDGGEDATRAYYIALHELGHALGIGHSNNLESIMYPRTYDGLLDGDFDTDRTWYRIKPVEASIALTRVRR